MGQVLGFSHCKEFGSLSSTPDSTPPCTDGGNEESDFPELQTARDWSDDEEGRGGPDDEDDGGASSPSIWGTPRQSSLELTFSYFALSEAEASSRREHGARRRSRGGSRGGRGSSLTRTDTAETLPPPLDSPAEQWDPHFLSGDGEEEQEEEQEEERRRREERDVLRERLCLEQLDIHSRTMQPLGRDITQETQDVNTGSDVTETEEISGTQHGPTDSQSVLRVQEPALPVAMETSPAPHVEHADEAVPSASSAPIGRSPQEELARDGQSDEGLLCLYRAVMDLIYWKDMERTGMVLTGVVVALLSLFQLSIITVISTLSLAIMCFTISVRVYYRVLQAIQWADGTHPFQKYLDLDITLHGEEADRYMQKALMLAFSALDSLKNLLFVGSLLDSLKFLLLMYLVTFLGNLCNGLTLLIVGVIAVFSVPLFYRQHQDKVDGVIGGLYARVDNVKDFFHRLAQGGGPPPDPTPGGAKPKAK
ncbi:reticulon-2a isoform X1 [Alosa alosa]|uniref:reticulon-2a isoform X1 n=1 Tax=Alosa alosa TaxID=278164 RepID=UPI002015369A|nr:reticulon-2a isoform X1 [Alosa alosa]